MRKFASFWDKNTKKQLYMVLLPQIANVKSTDNNSRYCTNRGNTHVYFSKISLKSAAFECIYLVDTFHIRVFCTLHLHFRIHRSSSGDNFNVYIYIFDTYPSIRVDLGS